MLPILPAAWAYLLRRLLVVVPLAGMAGMLGGLAAGLTVALLASTGLLVWHVVQLGRLVQWLQEPDPATVPEASGPWGRTFLALYRLQRKAEQGSELLREALTRFQDAGAALPDGVVIMDTDDRIEWCNPLAEAHLGIQLARDHGQQLTYLMRQPQFLEWLQAGQYDTPLVLRNARNEGITLLFRLVRYGPREKLVVSRDITLLDNAERVRRDFVANVSHELRTPITVLAGFLETLEDHPDMDREAFTRAITLMRSQAGRMQHLVEELLTLSRLESEHGAPPDEACVVRELIELLVRETESLSAGRHVVRYAVDSDDLLTGSRSELHSAFSNLASNAVRYTPDGGEIVLRWHRDTRGEGCFSVRDTGIGIPAEHLPRLTERFYRVDPGRSRSTGGTGLGLAIVQHVLGRHDGRLEIQSEPGRGSLFTAHLPAERVAARQPAG